MKIRTGNEIKGFNIAPDKCTSIVWLIGPNDECHHMRERR